MGLRIAPTVGQRPLAALPHPEEVFLSWLIVLPEAFDPVLATDAEIRRLNGYTGSHPGPARLLALFTAFRETLEMPRGHAGNQ